jgi:hypothetical protein
MARAHVGLAEFAKVSMPASGEAREPDMKMMEL